MYVFTRHNWSPQRLFQMLEDCLLREKEFWRKTPLLNTPDQLTQISPAHRDYAVTWMSHLNVRCNFYPETFFLAVDNLDRFLTTVKSHPKYLKCIAATCLYIASKILEEEEFYYFAFLDDMVEETSNDTRLTDNVNVYVMTKQFRELTEELQRAVCSYSIAPFRSATIALALLSLRANKLPEKAPWSLIVDRMQAKAAIKKAELDQCRYVLQTLLPNRLDNYTTLSNAVYVITTPYKRSSSEDYVNLPHQSAPTKRKAMESDGNLDSMECVKKFHQNQENQGIGDVISDSIVDLKGEPCVTVKEDHDIDHQSELPSPCPPLKKLQNCNTEVGSQLINLAKKKHLTYAEIVKLRAMTVCEE